MKKNLFLLVFVLFICTAPLVSAEETTDLKNDNLTPAIGAAGPALSIDSVHKYEGMGKSYAEGYLPAVSENKAMVVLPLLAPEVRDNLTVTVNLGTPADTPFVFKNYQKQFTSQSYVFEEQEVDCFLIQFALPLSAERLNGTYPLILTVKGNTADGEAFAEDFTLYLTITDGINPLAPTPEPAPAPSSQPKLMVESFALSQDYLAAGEQAKLKVTLRNTSSSQSVKNIKLSFTENSGEILPVATGAKYCKQISKGSTYTWNFEVSATTTAQSKPHPATITMEYEDNRGNAVSGADQIIIQVRQPVRLEYEEPTLPTRVTQGDTPSFSMTLMNLGKSTIFNALLKFELPGLSSGGSVLVGTIPPGETAVGRANFRLDTDALGDVSGKLCLSYEDEYGEHYESEIPLATTIEKRLELAAPADKKETASSSFPWTIAIVSGCIVLIALLSIFGSRWLQQKRARAEDEMRL
ncbi:MAG TPA: hypothetical protein VFC74_08145 [Oscillospiraceae bacterium]|nr:hypothetical protein [Oscillospiraceae bacterium]